MKHLPGITTILAIVILCSYTLTSCEDSIVSLRQDYLKRERDPRLFGCWIIGLPQADGTPVGKEGQVHILRGDSIDKSTKMIEFTPDGHVIHRVRLSSKEWHEINRDSETVYYTVNNARLYSVNLPKSKSPTYAKEDFDYTIVGDKLFLGENKYERQ